MECIKCKTKFIPIDYYYLIDDYCNIYDMKCKQCTDIENKNFYNYLIKLFKKLI